MKKILLFVLLVSGLIFSFERLLETNAIGGKLYAKASLLEQNQTKPARTLLEPKKSKPKIVTLKPGEPNELAYDAGTVRFLASGEDTGSAWSVVELKELPGYKTRFHKHNHTDEAYYVLEGVLTAKIVDKIYELAAGSYIVIPRGTPHGQGNFGKVPVRVLLTMTPSGFEESFKARAELFKTVKPNHPDYAKRREEIRRKYDAEYLGEWDFGK